MGNLIRLLTRSDGGADRSSDVFIDMEFAEPTEAEQAHYASAVAVLARTDEIMRSMREYPGAANEIRNALTDPNNEELQERAWASVQDLVRRLQEAYSFGQELETLISSLLESLCSAEKTAKEHLEQQQALFTQFALIIDFVIKFDEVKMKTPTMTNDLSYYKRVHRRHKTEGALSDEEVSKMSIFYAQHTPMMRLLTECTGAFMSAHKNLPVNTTSECLAAIADICRGLVANPDLRQRLKKPEETVPLCLRVMVGVCVLYDYVHPLGVFARGSLVDIRACIRVLRPDQHHQAQQPGEKQLCEALLNVLKYSTRTLNNPSTPKSLQALLSD
ncbi:hypothetical protein BOX15_Mlig003528g1 [Macrostomum lignano]|uniref:Uncharacterized protein n=2 Tax=Macrostomum lignano TaxID=282301 RepID=A0A267ETU6_9PLAT|nr:hypothetical protein BOX15_Mlig032716g1 [Macrostomum lignano]PAA64963.1 hypothetical protein BOX15_Mlig003528g1 [Macrostomum lignano]